MQSTRMRLMAAVSLLVGWGGVNGAHAVEAPAEPAGQIKARERLLKAVTVDGVMKHEKALARIAKQNDGTRASGTPGYGASVRYVTTQLKKAGYKVTVQPFTYRFFEETAPPTMARTSPNPTTFVAGTDFLSMEYSAGGAVAGRLVPTNDVIIPPPAVPGSTSGCELADFPTPPAADSVALIQRGTCTFAQKALNAAAAGYAAAVIFNEGQPGRDELLGGTLGAEEPIPIPVLGTTYALGKTLYEQARTGPVTVSLSVTAETGERTTRNVLADSPGGRSNNVVVIGAHLDSVPEGAGINDNGSGTSTILEVARQISRLGLSTRNKLRFAFWGAEESGLVGSTYYVANLSEKQLAQIGLNLNFDMVGSPNFVRFVYDGDGSATPDDPDDAGPPGSDLIEEVFVDFFTRRGLATAPTAFDGRSDYGPFIDQGIPAGGLFTGAEGIKTEAEAAIFGGTAGQPYDPCYHQACDNLGNLSPKALDQMSDAIAYSVLWFGNREAPVAKLQVATAQAASTQLLYRGNRLQR